MMETTHDTSAITNTGITSATIERAMLLLGNGYSAETVANACGVSASRISQLMADSVFATKVAELKFANLQKHNEMDSSYDSMESTLMKNLKAVAPLMFRPMEILKAISVINGAKRRGSSAPEQALAHSAIVNLVMPVSITQKFTTNVQNQVISAGDQTLLTIQSGKLLEASKDRALAIQQENPNGLNTILIG